MEDNKNKQMKDVLAFIAMVAVGAVLIVLFGELAKHFIASDTLYFAVINHVYLLAAAAFLLCLGIGWYGLNHVRNLAAFFVLLMILLSVAYEVDCIVTGSASSSAGLLIMRVSQHYSQMFLTGIDGLSLLLGAAGAFLLLWKGLDRLKDVLTGATKSS